MLNFLNILYKKIKTDLSGYLFVDGHESLLNNVKISLLVFEHRLINLTTGESCELDDDSAENIAESAAKVMQNSKKTPNLALFLPSSEFVATQYNLPEVDKHDILAALKYQQEELLPACQQALLVAVSHDHLANDNRAFWFAKERSDTIFDAFFKHKLNVSAIFPASLIFASSNQKTNQVFCEQGEEYFLITSYNKQKLTNWDFFYKTDLEHKEFSEQFEQQWQSTYPELLFSSVDCVDTEDKWLKYKRHSLADTLPDKEYAFFPAKAEAFIKNQNRFRKGRFIGIAMVGLTLVFIMPFIMNSVKYHSAKQSYNNIQTQTTAVRKAREMVLNYEDNWAAFNQYPQIEISQILLKINALIPKDSWLSTLELKKGYLEIEGYSPSPSSILELLSQQEEFDQTVFNQNIRSERGKDKEHFGIKLHLVGIDEDAYFVDFFSNDD